MSVVFSAFMLKFASSANLLCSKSGGLSRNFDRFHWL